MVGPVRTTVNKPAAPTAPAPTKIRNWLRAALAARAGVAGTLPR